MQINHFDQSLVLIPVPHGLDAASGKPMADICGAPMIVAGRAPRVEANVGRVVAAVDHEEETFNAVTAAGFEAVMTREDHQSGSDRIFEALEKADPQGRARFVINVQGDLPTIEPGNSARSACPLDDQGRSISRR